MVLFKPEDVPDGAGTMHQGNILAFGPSLNYDTVSPQRQIRGD